MDSKNAMTTRATAVSRELEHVPKKYRKMYERVCACETGQKRQIIRVACLHCCNWQGAEVKGCTSYTCPLWGYR